MSPKVLLTGISHETHAFNPNLTTRQDFLSRQWLEGDEIGQRHRGERSTYGAFYEIAERESWEVLPSIAIAAMPAGKVEHQVVEEYLDKLLTHIRDHVDHLDAIFWLMHGAMVSTKWDDVEGELLARVRAELQSHGKSSLPIVGVLDLHVNFSPAMAEHANALVVYRTNPHIDSFDSSLRAAEILCGIFKEGSFPITRFRHPPLIFSPKGTGTAKDPLKSVLARAREIEDNDENVLCVNVIGGYAYADHEHTGFSVSVVAREERDNIEEYLDDLCRIADEHKDEGHPQDLSLDEALQQVKNAKELPALLVESSDNIGAGTPGDGTHALRALLDSDIKGIVAVINDPECARLCHEKGLNESIELELGAKRDTLHGTPIVLEAKIIGLSQGEFTLEDPKSHLSILGQHIEMGSCATIKVEDRATILITSEKTPPMDLGQLHSQGIEVRKAKVILIKAAVSHRQAYDPISNNNIYVDTPGLGSSNLHNFNYQNLPRPIFPLDS